jgi:membrane-bound ClpP family serine protease
MITLLTILGWMALAGGIAVALQLLSTIFGFDSTDTDIDVGDMDIDGDVDSDTAGSGVKVFSILGISSFLLVFGLVGRICILQILLHWSLALLIATVAGLLIMYLIGWLFYKAKSLETNGTIKMKDSINCTGTVYLPFKDDELGTVHVDVNGIMREYGAKSNNGEVFKVGDSIKVIGTKGNYTQVIKNN